MAALRRVDAAGRLPGEALVEVRGLAVVRGGRRILDVADLAIPAGRTLAVVGPNGAGKSTLLLALAGLVRIDDGVVAYGGQPLPGRGDLAHRRRIGLVLPAPLLLSASVLDNVAAGLRFRGIRGAEARRRVEAWLERLGVAHLRDRHAAGLSTGEAQRVSLARALVLEPELLLLDEPFGSLDPVTRAELTDDFDRLRRGTATTCVLVTHDLEEAVRLGDQMAVLLDGRVRQCDDPATVLAAPADDAVAGFVGAPAGIRGRVLAARDGLVVVDVGTGLRPGLSARAAELLRRTASETAATPPVAAHDVDIADAGAGPGPADPGGS